MINFFYYLYYRLKQANSKPGNHPDKGMQAAYISIVLLLILNCLSVYFLLIGFINQHLAFRIWTEDKMFNQTVSFIILVAVPTGVYGWYKRHPNCIEQAAISERKFGRTAGKWRLDYVVYFGLVRLANFISFSTSFILSNLTSLQSLHLS